METARKKVKIDINLNEYQWKFFNCDSKRIAYYGEFRSGKTTAAGLKVLKLLQEYPGTFCAIIRNRHQDLEDSTIPQLKAIYDWDLTGEKFNKSTKKLIMRNGSIIRFFALDRPEDQRKLKNIDIGIFWIDQAEEIPVEIFLMAEGRLSQANAPHVGIVTGNPEGKLWDYYKFFARPLDTILENYTPTLPSGVELKPERMERGTFQGENDGYIGFLPPPFLNEKNIPEHYYYNLIMTHSQGWNDKYVYGKFSGNAGLLHPDFTDYNKIEGLESPHQLWIRVDGMDYGVANPTAWLIAYYSRENDTIYIYDEYYVAGQSIHYHGPKIQTLRNQWGNPDLTVGCPRAFQTERDGKTPAMEYSENYGINMIPYPVGLETRVEVCNRRFKQGKIKIHERCRNLIRQIEGATWKNYEKNFENHALEAFQRLVAKVDQSSNWHHIEQNMLETKTKTLTGGMLNMDF